MNSKPWYMSKTIWFNAITALVALCGSVGAVVPANWMPVIGLVAAVGNVLLRFISNQPLTQ